MTDDETTGPDGSLTAPDGSPAVPDGSPAVSDGSPTSSPTNTGPAALLSRRRLLGGVASGGAIALAGCGQYLPGQGPSTGTFPGTPNGTDVVDQTFRAPTSDRPANTTFFGRFTLGNALFSAIAQTVRRNASFRLQRLLWEAGLWPDGLFIGAGDVHYTWIEEPIEISPTEITISIRDDARWSDGNRITGRDIACIPIQQSLRQHNRPFYAAGGPDTPDSIWTAYDGFEITDTSVTYTSSPGHFDQFWDIHIKNRLGTYLGPQHLPTHVEPYEAYADAVIRAAKRAQAGEIDPWDPASGDPSKRSLVREHLADKQYVETFSRPENVLATGAWDLTGSNETEFVFEPNVHHRNADNVNFEELILEYTDSADRMRAAVKADEFDFASTEFGQPTPPEVVESFPDTIEQLLVPGNQYTGTEIGLTFDHPGLGKRAVRAAIMYALDHEAITANIHPEVAPPVTTPGGDCWDATEWASEAWLDENLITYDTDRDRAATLMRQAGFTRKGGQWHGEDGEALTLTLATSSDTPLWEPAVANQLSQFGIQTTVQTLGGQAFSQRVDSGEFPMWPTTINAATNLVPYTLFVWRDAAEEPDKFGIYPDEQFQTGNFYKGKPTPVTEERYNVFTIEAPPVGKPSNARTEYHPAALALYFSSSPPEAEFRRRMKTGMWLANWYLPTIPIAKRLEQFFIDSAHWVWPRDTPFWKSFTGGSSVLSGSLFAEGTIRANPDNPEG